MAVIIITFLSILIIVLCMCSCINHYEIEAKEKEKKQIEEREKLRQKIASWWLESKFNSFKVVKKYTTMLSDNRYRQVLIQEATGEYFDIVCGVNTYYNFQEEDYISFTHTKTAIPYLTKEVIEEFNKATGNNVEYKDVCPSFSDFQF